MPLLINFLMSVLLAHQVSGNFPRDLYGPIDLRDGTWGHAEADYLKIDFTRGVNGAPPVPAGYRVKILRLRGDLTYTPKILDKGTAKGYAWALIGFSTTANEGSVLCDYCADRCHLYIQDASKDGEVRHVPFDWDVDMVLEPDNVLVLQIADFLNQTDYPLHIEATYNIKFVFVPQVSG